MNNRDKSALSLALAIVGGIAAGLRCDASEWVDNSSQYTPRVAAYTVKAYTEGSDPFDAKKVGDYAEERGVQMSIHMAESPIAAMAAVHVAAATRNFMALEIHSVDVPWWKDIVVPAFRIEDGFVKVPDAPGLGIEALNEDLIQSYLHESFPEAWSSTDGWNDEWSNDRRWS